MGRVREKRGVEERRVEDRRVEERRVEERRVEERRVEERKRKSQKKEDTGARNVRKVAKDYVFPMILGREGGKVGSLKRRVRSHLARGEMKIIARGCGTKHILKSKCTKHTILGPLWDFQKVHSVAARSTF